MVKVANLIKGLQRHAPGGYDNDGKPDAQHEAGDVVCSPAGFTLPLTVNAPPNMTS